MYNDKYKYRELIRRKYNISRNDKVIIYSGRLVKIKNIKSVIKAINKINKNNIVFLIVGDGELNTELSELSKELNIKCVITGFIEKQEELFKHYFAGDCFILPSIDEPWGLVVNEAMAAGLPIIVSDICGCSKDLVVDGENGYIVNSKNIDEMANKIKEILFDSNIELIGRKSKKIISSWNFSNSRLELEKIINSLKNRE